MTHLAEGTMRAMRDALKAAGLTSPDGTYVQGSTDAVLTALRSQGGKASVEAMGEQLNVAHDILGSVLGYLDGDSPNAKEGLITEIRAFLSGAKLHSPSGKDIHSCGAESNRHSGAVGMEKRAEQSNPGGGHALAPKMPNEIEKKAGPDEPTPGQPLRSPAESVVKPTDANISVLAEALYHCGCPAGGMTVGECAEQGVCGCSIRADRIKGCMGTEHQSFPREGRSDV